jgi:N-acetylglucosamine-6-sulfatase
MASMRIPRQLQAGYVRPKWHRNTFLLAVPLAMALQTSTGPTVQHDPTSITTVAPLPSIVVIRTDDQSLTDMLEIRPDTGHLVMQHVQESIADRGMTFQNTLVSVSLCCPSRATFFSGQYAHNHHVYGNDPPFGGYRAFDHANALPVWLQNAGYHTVHVGKYMNHYSGVGVPPGWSEWFTSSSQRYYEYFLNENGSQVFYGLSPADYATDVYTGKALDFLANRASGAQPFYLMLDYIAPHRNGGPNDPLGPSAIPAPRDAHVFDQGYVMPRPENYNERDVSDKPPGIQALPLLDDTARAAILSEHKARLGALLSVDAGVGRIVHQLEVTGLLDSTVIVFTSDNGYEQGEHRIAAEKNTPYEESARVPLIISGPGILHLSVSEVVSSIDIAPTLVDLGRASPGRLMDGLSLVPILTGTGTLPSRSILLEHYDYTDPLRDVPIDCSGIRNGDLKYLEYYDNSGRITFRELYNYSPDFCQPMGDPYELDNQAGNPCYAHLITVLHDQLQSLRGCSGRSCQ